MATKQELADDLLSRPTLDLWPDAAGVLGIGRNLVYKAAASGEIPTLRFGNRIVVPTARLKDMLGLPAARPGKAA